MNTMSDEYYVARVMLEDAGMSLLDAVRVVRQMLDFKPKGQGAVVCCSKVVQAGLAQRHLKEMRVRDGFALYLAGKGHLRAASRHDIEYLWRRLARACPSFAGAQFAEISLADCERWLGECFSTASQFNKGRTMLHGLFEFAMRREWCDRNVVKLVPRKRVVEQEIRALEMPDIQRLVRVSEQPEFAPCAAGVALMLWAGLRPTEVRRLRWRDVDLAEKCITVRAECSKTGGVRQVDICRALEARLSRLRRHHLPDEHALICPPDWQPRWRKIRNAAGFAGRWVQDVLRHTFASYHAKHYKNMALLQWNMGHRDQNLLRSRYVNLQGITQVAAKVFFSLRCG